MRSINSIIKRPYIVAKNGINGRKISIPQEVKIYNEKSVFFVNEEDTGIITLIPESYLKKNNMICPYCGFYKGNSQKTCGRPSCIEKLEKGALK